MCDENTSVYYCHSEPIASRELNKSLGLLKDLAPEDRNMLKNSRINLDLNMQLSRSWQSGHLKVDLLRKCPEGVLLVLELYLTEQGKR